MDTPMTAAQVEAARAIALAFHLSSMFVPPLPQEHRTKMMECFEAYWNGELDLQEFQFELNDYAGFVPPIEECGLYQFLLNRDVH